MFINSKICTFEKARGNASIRKLIAVAMYISLPVRPVVPIDCQHNVETPALSTSVMDDAIV